MRVNGREVSLSEFYLAYRCDSLQQETTRLEVSDFVPRLQTCQMINGECLNGYKAVVRGFRQSEAQGIKAAQTFFQEQTSILSFRERSSSFFRQLDGAFTNVGDEQEDDARQCQLYLASLEVCGSLPPRIRAKTGLGTQSGGQV